MSRPVGIRRLSTALLLVMSVMLAFGAGSASALVYWTVNTSSGGVLDRAKLDGSSQGQLWNATGTPLAVNSQYIVYYYNGSLDRIDLAADPSSQKGLANLSGITGVALDSTYVYFSEQGGNTIVREGFDGSGYTTLASSGCSQTAGIAVDSNYLYWPCEADGTIRRAPLSNPGSSTVLIPNAGAPTALAVNDSYIYWADQATPGIDRAPIGGGTVTAPLIAVANPVGVALDFNYVYWTNANQQSPTVGRANLDGTGANPSFITSSVQGAIGGVAVDSLTSFPSSSGGGLGGNGGGGGGGITTHCLVPRLAGKTLGQARHLLAAAHCKLGKVTKPKHPKGKLVVVGQSPVAGRQLPAGAEVSVRLGRARKHKK